MIKPHEDIGLVAHFPNSGRFRVGEEFPWIDPETNEIAIAWRLLGMAARIHEHEPPETIAREAKAAREELKHCEGGAIRSFAEDVAERLEAYALSVTPAARELAEYVLADAVEALRDSISAITGRAAA